MKVVFTPSGIVKTSCYVDLFFNNALDKSNFSIQLSNGRRTIVIDNRHRFHRWFVSYELKTSNKKVYTTYGIHPKYIPSNLDQVFEQLYNILKNRFSVRTETVAIGECGLDDTSSSSVELPIVLHGRGKNYFDLMLNELKSH